MKFIKLGIILWLVFLASLSYGVEIYVVQFGEAEYIPCRDTGRGNVNLLVACFSSPTREICHDLDCVRRTIRGGKGATHVYRIECDFLLGWVPESCKVVEMKLVRTVDVE